MSEIKVSTSRSNHSPVASLRSSPSDTEAEARKLTTLLEIGQTLAGTLDLKSAMHRALEKLGRHHGMVRSTVLLYDPEADELRVESSYGIKDEAARRLTYRMGEGVPGRVAQTGKPIIVPRVSREPTLVEKSKGRKNLGVARELSFICVPVMINRKTVGAFSTHLPYDAGRDFEKTKEFLAIAASMVAQAIKV
ncbi:MAG TPA: GAF domain-containing protein, partial [Pyrinomonadaceae bacterium]|nr:GAF domain-containing protein [Pyrinomonadaceae bacterium]